MRVFKTKVFNKWSKKEGLNDKILLEAINEVEKGLIDGDLGGNIYKKRISKLGQGKRGSTRTIIAFRIREKAFFIYGFSKSDKENINNKELEALKKYASLILNFTEFELKEALVRGELMEVKNV